MKYFFSFAIFLAGFIMQSTVINGISLWGVTPNLILCLTIIFAFLYDGYEGLLFGVLFGLFQDIFFGEVIGIAAISYLIIGLAVGGAKKQINKEHVFSTFILILGGTLAFNLLYWSLSSLFGAGYSVVTMLKLQIVAIPYNVVIAVMLYFWLIQKVVRHPTDKYIKGTFINYE